MNIFTGRPWWMNGLLVFCAYMTFIYMPFDMFYKPVEEDQEVWFGLMLTGWAAKLTEPLHWLIYGYGTYGFIKMKNWMWPWASVYMAQVCFGMLVWSVTDERGRWQMGLISFALLSPLAVALWRSKARFIPERLSNEN
jgi:hypothetical protein